MFKELTEVGRKVAERVIWGGLHGSFSAEAQIVKPRAKLTYSGC